MESLTAQRIDLQRKHGSVTYAFTAVFGLCFIVFNIHKTGSATETCVAYNSICYNKLQYTHSHRADLSIKWSINVCPQAEVPR